MNFLLLLLFVCCYGYSPAQTLNYTDANGIKQGYWILYGEPEFNIPDTVKTEEGTFINGRKEGEWIRYNPDGSKHMILTYKNGRQERIQLIYPERNYTVDKIEARRILEEEFGFKKKINQKDDEGKKQGHWIYYGKDRPESGIADSGKVEEGNYTDDRKEGRWVRYNADGSFRMAGVYENNRPRSGTYTKGRGFVTALGKHHSSNECSAHPDSLVFGPDGQLRKATIYDTDCNMRLFLQRSDYAEISSRTAAQNTLHQHMQLVRLADSLIQPFVGCIDSGYYCATVNTQQYYIGLFKKGTLVDGIIIHTDSLGKTIRKDCFFNGHYSWSYVEPKTRMLFHKDEDNKKRGYAVFTGEDKPESGIAPHGKVEEGNYVNDRKEGWWIKYHNNGETPKLIGQYVNNRPFGRYYKFYPNGTLRETSFFGKNNYYDTLWRYDEHGRTETILVYDTAGVLKKEVFPIEQVIIPYGGCGGPPVNPSPAHIDQGSIGKPAPAVPPGNCFTPTKFMVNGVNKIYNDDKEIWMDGVFKDGKLWDGKVYVYDRDGILLKVQMFKSGVYHSDGQL